MNIAGAIRSTLGRLRGASTTATDASPWFDTVDTPWTRLGSTGPGVECNVCGWAGDAFEGMEHCESSLCPRCGSIGRDRFLVHCLATTVPPARGLRLLETSPRMGEGYRACMARWFDYTTSDFDERAHKGAIQLDLQAMDLPDASIDVFMTAHVLEHVPETDKALHELHRVLRPGGWLILQVPLLQAVTAPPVEPEFHGDNTPVFWRFGFDLTDRLRSSGFDTSLLCTEEMLTLVRSGATAWPGEPSPEFDADALVSGAIESDLTAVASPAAALRMALRPAYQYFTWVGQRT